MQRRDPPSCREDLIKLAAAAGEGFRPAFDWIDDKTAIRVSSDPANRGLTAGEIREIAAAWILRGKQITCVREQRVPYRDERHFYYFVIVVEGLPDFPRGLFIEMDLENCDENDPTARLLNAHPPSVK